MKYLLDTDHLSIIQREKGQDYANLSTRMAQYPLLDFAIFIVTFHEQILGSHTYINRARNSNEIVKGYEMIERIRKDFIILPIILFDRAAVLVFERLQVQRIQMATMDLRIASIALSRGLILLTRNSRDFEKVPMLTIEDWTISANNG